MMSNIPADPDTLLRRIPNSDALIESGFQVSPATLATLASRGGGPPFRRFGRYPVYRWGDSLEWAKAKLSPLLHSTAEAEQRVSNGEGIRGLDDAGPPKVVPRDGPGRSDQRRAVPRRAVNASGEGASARPSRAAAPTDRVTTTAR
jgi:hypothetical protein